MISAILFGGFTALMLLGVPVAISVGVSVVAAVYYAGFGDSLYIVPQQMLEGVNNASLVALPFFILTGNLMNAGGMTDRIFAFATALVGHLRAGLAQVNVVASVVFSGINGTSVGDIGAMGPMEIRAMRKDGYSPDFAAALTVVSAVVGPLIPPSVGLIIYAHLANVSIARLFLAGVVPGFLIAVCLMIYNRLYAIRHDLPLRPRATLRELGSKGKDGFISLVAPIIIMVTVLTGYATATEAGVVACCYALVVGLFYRTLTWRGVWKAMYDTVLITAVVMAIIAFSTGMSWLLAIEQAPQDLALSITSATDNKFVFLILLLLALVLIGCFMEGVPAKLILVPVLLPLIDAFGVDRIHFGIIVQLALLVGIATPPMGIGLYLVAEIAKIPFERVSLAVLPLLIPVIVALLLITFVPQFSLYLPELILGPEQ